MPESASAEIDRKIHELDDWRGEALSRMRALIRDADVRRAIDIRESGQVDAEAFKALIRASVELNARGKAKR